MLISSMHIAVILFETSIRSSTTLPHIFPPNELCFVFQCTVFHDSVTASEGKPRPRDLFEIITENEKFAEYLLIYLSLRVPEYYIEYSIEHQPAKVLREIEHALIQQYAIASESYAPKFVCL